jgi:hypothetical protein
VFVDKGESDASVAALNAFLTVGLFKPLGQAMMN